MKNLIKEIKFWVNLYRIVKRMDPEERNSLLRFVPNDVY